MPPAEVRGGASHRLRAQKSSSRLAQPSRTDLVVKLIGRFEIKFDDQPVTLPSRTAQSLFAYLALNPGVPHRREKLAGMFWPDEPEKKARAYLRTELWRIRKSLAGSRTDYIVADSINISFDPAAGCWLDADVLRNLSHTASVEELKSALSLCEGELLPGFYDEWSISEREHLRAAYESRMARLLELLGNEKRWNEILEWAERWIAYGQVPEDAYRVLMSAYDALGDRAMVGATYRRCVEALQQLDLEPSEQTRALALKRTSKLNLPVPLTSFIGREDELREVTALLAKSRLITLTGSGGVGKTRLAIQVVADVLELFPDGVWFLDLAPVSDGTRVPDALAGSLRLSLMDPDLSMTELITNYLQSRKAMIIFDNCEHLIDACARLAGELLGSCPELKILATSREVLRVAGEVPYRVPSLEIPGLDIGSVVGTLARSESVRLFVERAAVVSPGFALGPSNALVIARICQRLGGIPLAIELAAARTHILAVEHILRRLDDRFNLLTGGSRTALPRQQTLRATIEWSYELLSEKERLLFKRLAVFIGGWTLEAAEAVCSGRGIQPGEVLDLLSQLVDKSLVLVETLNHGEAGGSSDSLRYRRLETVRQYAWGKLAEAGEEVPFRNQHLAYFLELAETAAPHLIRSEQIEWLERLDADHVNLRAAFEWSLGRDRPEAALRLSAALLEFWNLRWHWKEGLHWLEQALAMPCDDPTPAERAARARALNADAALAEKVDDHERMRASAEASLALCTQGSDPMALGIARFWVGFGWFLLDDHDRAMQFYEPALRVFRELDDVYWQWRAGYWLSVIKMMRGEAVVADVWARNLELARRMGGREALIGALQGLAAIAWEDGDLRQARAYLEEAERLDAGFGCFYGLGGLMQQGVMAHCCGEYPRAKELYMRVIERLELAGERISRSYDLISLGLLERDLGNLDLAKAHFEAALALQGALKPENGYVRALLGQICFLAGDQPGAREYFLQALPVTRTGRYGNREESLVLCLGLLAERRLDLAARILGALHAPYPDRAKLGLEPLLRKDHDDALAQVRLELGEAAYQAAWAEGEKLSVDQACDLALEALR